MLMNLLFGIPTMVLCLLLQSMLIVVAVRFYKRRDAEVANPSLWSTMMVVSSVMLILVFGNLAQLTIWAMLFLFLGEFSNLGDAVYHSAVNFATLGYGDVVMSDRHKFLGPLEAVNGVLMIGVSTAALTIVFQDAFRKTLRARQD
ncbi:MAG: two pore domain potassium channel family protein [Alphaproteobacteria bacterium]|nr:MAG: two pore domain potassium channel family protein [Alphaproteobacteria bacterium]